MVAGSADADGASIYDLHAIAGLRRLRWRGGLVSFFIR